jgi:aryl sulfotransferase
MTTPARITWPQKTREIQNAVMDSTRWNGFPFRDDDIVIATWAKSGTTWTQQIVGQMVLRDAGGIAAAEASPWLDFAPTPVKEVLDRLEAQTHRRFIKTHLPLDALVFSPRAKYLYVGRDGRDTLWSWHNHHVSFTDEAYEMFNNVPWRVGPPLERCPEDPVEHFRQMLDGRGSELPDLWEHYQGWFDARRLPNVLLLHFNHLKADLAGQMRRIAKFLDVEVPEAEWPGMVERCGFDYMKKTASGAPILQRIFQHGAEDFFHRGTNGRWRDVLPAEDNARYERIVRERLTPECARWMATGELPEGEQMPG